MIVRDPSSHITMFIEGEPKVVKGSGAVYGGERINVAGRGAPPPKAAGTPPPMGFRVCRTHKEEK